MGDSRLLAVPFYLFIDGAVDEGGCTFAMISRVFFLPFHGVPVAYGLLLPGILHYT